MCFVLYICIYFFLATIFAYGQTSSGKTYTMMGDDFTQGVIHYTINDIFKMIQTVSVA